MFRRDVIGKKIAELRLLLATTDDQLTVALVQMAIESFESEREALFEAANTDDRADAE